MLFSAKKVRRLRMKLVWMNDQEYGSFQLPLEISDCYRVDSRSVWKNCESQNITLTFEADSEKRNWILKSVSDVILLELAVGMGKTKQIDTLVIKPGYIFVVVDCGKGSVGRSYLYVEDGSESYCIYKTPLIAGKYEVTVGSNKQCSICYKSFNANESNYLRISYLENRFILEKEGTNITDFLVYVNKKAFHTNTTAYFGDEIYICGLKLILEREFVVVSDFVSEQRMISNLSLAQIDDDIEYDDMNISTDVVDEHYFSSAPYLPKHLEESEILIAAPPTMESKETMPIMLTLGPSIVMAISSVVTSCFSVTSILQSGGDITTIYPTLFMSFSMVVGSLIVPMITSGYTKLKERKNDDDNFAIYQEHIEKIKKEISKRKEEEKEKKEADYPSNENCFMLIRNRKDQLWRRTLDDTAFLSVNIGQAALPAKMTIHFPDINMYERENEYNEILKEIRQIAEEKQKMPFVYSLADHELTGLVGDGTDGDREYIKHLAFGMILQLMALQNYDDLKIGVIYNQEEKEWEELKWLPHVWSNDRSFRYMADTQEELSALMNDLEYEKETRMTVRGEERKYQIPKYVIFVADRKLAERSEKLKDFYKLKENIGISFVLLYDRRRYLPKYCKNIIQAGAADVRIIQCEEEEYNGVTMDTSAMENWSEIEKILPFIANIKLDILTGQKSFPESITLFEMLKIGKPEHYDFQRKWKESDPVKSLGVPIGVDSDGNEIILDIHEKAHGPHGLIAGSTGSGKSEFIISYIEMMALNFSPQEVAFILIDFKGGGMADVFHKIPHVVGRITNLDGNDLKRSLLAIENELARRQKRFQEAGKKLGISNIDIYRYQEKYRQGKLADPLPHLIIICDEFAELRQQNEEFLDQLVRIARIGRSLGVHMILATQKPDGVVSDQIRANIKFWICLKVQDKYDSKSVLDRPDAAAINAPGRFFMKVGANEVFVQGQSPFSGALYYPSEKAEKNKDDSIVVMDGMSRVIVKEQRYTGQEARKQIDVMNDYISKVYQGTVHKLWLDKLPIAKKRQEVSENGNELISGMAPYIGKYDDLQNQRQDDLVIPFSREGNAILYGIAGSGILQFLNRMLYELINKFDSSQLHLHLLDLDTGALSAFREAPQVQDVVLAYQTEQIGEVIRSLDGELDSRKKKFTEYGGSYQLYCQESGKKCPQIMLVINGVETFADIANLSMLEAVLKKLMREGTPYGIYVMATAENNQTIYRWMDQAFRLRYVLQQNTQDMYYNILGRTAIYPESGLGRGIFVRNQTAYEFQTDLLFEGEGENTYRCITQFCKKMKEKEQVKTGEVSEDRDEKCGIEWLQMEWNRSSLCRFPVGTAVASRKTVYYDLSSSVLHFWSYSTSTARQWQEKMIAQLAKRIPRVYCCGIENDIPMVNKLTITELMDVFITEVAKRANRIKQEIENAAGNSYGEDLARQNSISDAETWLFVIRGINDECEDLTLRNYFDRYVAKIRSYYRMPIILLENSRTLSSARFDPKVYLPYPQSGLWMEKETDNRSKLVHVEITEQTQIDYQSQGYVIQQVSDTQEVVLCDWVTFD